MKNYSFAVIFKFVAAILLLLPAPSWGLTFNKGVPFIQQGPGECGPVSAASSLLYWDSHGYDFIVPDSLETPSDLVGDLKTRMKTDAIAGTGDQDFLDGLHNYLQQDYVSNYFGITLYDSGTFMDPTGLDLVTDEIIGQIGFDEYFLELFTNKEDVLFALPGHWVVGNSLDNTLRDNGTPSDHSDDYYNIDLMDPERGDTNQYYNTRMRASDGNIFYGFPGDTATWQNVDVMIAISPVPEPATLTLFAFGIVGLIGHKRLNKHFCKP